LRCRAATASLGPAPALVANLTPVRRPGPRVMRLMARSRFNDPIEPMDLANMRENGVRSLAVQCPQCHHKVIMNVDHPTELAGARTVGQNERPRERRGSLTGVVTLPGSTRLRVDCLARISTSGSRNLNWRGVPKPTFRGAPAAPRQ
jgi:hypothetical protein